MITDYVTPEHPFAPGRIESQRSFILDDGHIIHLDSDMENFTDIYLFHQEDETVANDRKVDVPLEEATQLVCSLEHDGIDLIDRFFGEERYTEELL